MLYSSCRHYHSSSDSTWRNASSIFTPPTSLHISPSSLQPLEASRRCLRHIGFVLDTEAAACRDSTPAILPRLSSLLCQALGQLPPQHVFHPTRLQLPQLTPWNRAGSPSLKTARLLFSRPSVAQAGASLPRVARASGTCSLRATRQPRVDGGGSGHAVGPEPAQHQRRHWKRHDAAVAVWAAGVECLAAAVEAQTRAGGGDAQCLHGMSQEACQGELVVWWILRFYLSLSLSVCLIN